MIDERIDSGIEIRDDDRAAPAAEKQQDHQAGERGGDDGFADNAADRRRARKWTDRRSGLIRSSADVDLQRAAEYSRTPFTTSSVDAFPDFRMVISTPRWPSCRTMLVWTE